MKGYSCYLSYNPDSHGYFLIYTDNAHLVTYGGEAPSLVFKNRRILLQSLQKLHIRAHAAYYHDIRKDLSKVGFARAPMRCS